MDTLTQEAQKPVVSRIDPLTGKKRSGALPGGPNPGAFKKGADSRRNPGGKAPATKAEVGRLARAYTTEAIETIAGLMRDKDQPAPVRIECARQLLDRGHGRPVDRIAMAQFNPDGSGAAVGPVEALGDDELVRLIRRGVSDVAERMLEHRDRDEAGLGLEPEVEPVTVDAEFVREN